MRRISTTASQKAVHPGIIDPHLGFEQSCLHIFLAHRTPKVGKMIEKIFVRAGQPRLRVSHAERFDQLAGYISTGRPNAIALDWQLPGVPGFDTVVQLTATNPELPLVVFCVGEHEKLARESLRCGARDFLLEGKLVSLSLYRALLLGIERRQRRYAEKKLMESENCSNEI